MQKKYWIVAINVIFLSIISLNLPVFAQNSGKKSIAILNFRANNVSSSLAEAVRDMVEVYIYKSGGFEILERNSIDLIIREQGLKKKGCSDNKCAVKIGKLASSDLVLIGSISKIKNYLISVKVINSTSSRLIYADSEKVKNKDLISKSVKKLIYRTASRVNRELGELPSEITATGYYLRGIVPGWGQIYAGHTTRGLLYSSAFVLSGLFMGYGIYDFKVKREEYLDSIGADRDILYSRSDDAFFRANLLIGVFVAVYVVNWIDILFFSKPDFERYEGAMMPQFNDGLVINMQFERHGFWVSAGYGIRF